MKKHIALALGLVSMTGSVYASKARLEALGQDANGSQFIGDNRNVFLNAAHVNLHKNLATFEWGNTAYPVDGTATPRAEGGVFMESGAMVWGVYMGNESNTSNRLRARTIGAALGGANSALAQETNNIDLFIGGDAGVQWGAALTYGNVAKGDGDVSSSAMRLNLGVISGDIEGFANLGVMNSVKSEALDAEFKGKMSMDLGVTYNMDDLAVFARYGMADATFSAATDTELKTGRMNLGVAKNYKLNEKANLWISGQYATTTQKVGDADADTTTSLPVGIALEVSAREWLVLRGSVTQNVLVSEESKGGNKAPVRDTTSVRAGASLVFGDFSLDGVVGNLNGDGAFDNSPGSTNPADVGQNGVLRTDALMSRVSMTYRF
jgi:hypothetical protein